MKNLLNILKMISSGLVLGVCTLFYTNVHAQGWCTDWRPECAATIEQGRNGNYGNGTFPNDAGSAPVYAPPKASKYGAVAWDNKAGVYGYSVGQPTKSLANAFT